MQLAEVKVLQNDQTIFEFFPESKTSISKANTISDIHLCCISDCGIFFIGDAKTWKILYGAT